MAKGYSCVLRPRAMQSVEEGMSLQAASEISSISRKVIYDWKQLNQQSVDIKRKKGYQMGHRWVIKNWDASANFFEQNPNKTGTTLARAKP